MRGPLLARTYGFGAAAVLLVPIGHLPAGGRPSRSALASRVPALLLTALLVWLAMLPRSAPREEDRLEWTPFVPPALAPAAQAPARPEPVARARVPAAVERKPRPPAPRAVARSNDPPAPREEGKRTPRLRAAAPHPSSSRRQPRAAPLPAAPALTETRAQSARIARLERPAAGRQPSLRVAPVAPVSTQLRPALHGADASAARASQRVVPRADEPLVRADPETAPRGVPLAAFAACLSDREELRLKQRIVAAVTTQQECATPDAVYRFVQVRNVNAFLLRIEHTGATRAGDRCAELARALSCLASSDLARLR